MYGSIWRAIKYYLDCLIRLGGYLVNVFVVGDCQHERPSNIIYVVPSDQADTVQIFTQCKQWSA